MMIATSIPGPTAGTTTAVSSTADPTSKDSWKTLEGAARKEAQEAWKAARKGVVAEPVVTEPKRTGTWAPTWIYGGGTSVDSSATRSDFSYEDAPLDDDQARRYALGTQATERTDRLVARLAEPVFATELGTERRDEDRKAAATTANTGYADNLKTLRGQTETAGTMLDRAA